MEIQGTRMCTCALQRFRKSLTASRQTQVAKDEGFVAALRYLIDDNEDVHTQHDTAQTNGSQMFHLHPPFLLQDGSALDRRSLNLRYSLMLRSVTASESRQIWQCRKRPTVGRRDSARHGGTTTTCMGGIPMSHHNRDAGYQVTMHAQCAAGIYRCRGSLCGQERYLLADGEVLAEGGVAQGRAVELVRSLLEQVSQDVGEQDGLVLPGFEGSVHMGHIHDCWWSSCAGNQAWDRQHHC